LPLLIPVAGRLGNVKGALAFPIPDLDSPDSAPALISNLLRAEDLAQAGMRSGVDLEPFSHLAEVAEDSRPGLAPRAVEHDRNGVRARACLDPDHKRTISRIVTH
jgi:hypothetical protein